MGGGLLKMEKDESESEIDDFIVFNLLESCPEGFVANALALTNPRDVCRLSLVSSVFRSAAHRLGDFLPPDYYRILTKASGGADAGGDGSKKELYLRFCDHPVILSLTVAKRNLSRSQEYEKKNVNSKAKQKKPQLT